MASLDDPGLGPGFFAAKLRRFRSFLDFGCGLSVYEPVHTVVETPPYLRSAEEAGISEDERWEIVTMLAKIPELGDVIQGTGGCRKLRVAGRGKGRSGGYRIITFYTGVNIPVFLLTVFGKSEKADLTSTERNGLKSLTKAISSTYGKKVVSLRRKT